MSKNKRRFVKNALLTSSNMRDETEQALRGLEGLEGGERVEKVDRV